MWPWPATPTPMPPGVAHFDLPTQYYNLWDGPIDFWFQLWHWAGSGAVVLQSALLLVLIVTFVAVIIKFFRLFTRRDAES